MRKGLLGLTAALTAGAGMAFGQGPAGMAAPMPIAPSGGGVTPAAFNNLSPIAPPIGAPPMNGLGFADGGMQPPMYPQPGIPGGSPYPDAGGGSGPSGAVPNFWFTGEYTLLFATSQRLNGPLVTTSAPGDLGAVGAPTTQSLFGGGDVGVGSIGGMRLMAGWWCDASKRTGFEFGGTLTEQKNKLFSATSDSNGVPTLARPFNVAGGGTGVYLVSGLGLGSGSVSVSNGFRSFGVEANLITNLYRSCPGDGCFWNVDGIAGVRVWELRESLEFASSTTILAGGASFVGQPITAGSVVDVQDSFRTNNQFYGGQLGIRASANCGRWTFTGVAKCGFGLMHQTVDIAGNTRLTDGTLGINAVAQGGVLATRDNIGNFRNDEFAVLPEATLTLAYNWSGGFSTFIGYTGMYTNRVVRPGTSLPLAVNPSLQPSSNSFGLGGNVPVPSSAITQTEFYLQGVTFGFNLRF